MALQNIGAGNRDDPFYRYKMPTMITKFEGRGNGIKINIVNMVDIAKSLSRPAAYITKYFGWELGALSKFDDKTGTSHVNGAHDASKLAGLLETFIKKFVVCHGCAGNPETEIILTKSQMINLKCAACGSTSEVDMRHKLTAFIIKNPPMLEKGSKDKKAMRRAEKERRLMSLRKLRKKPRRRRRLHLVVLRMLLRIMKLLKTVMMMMMMMMMLSGRLIHLLWLHNKLLKNS